MSVCKEGKTIQCDADTDSSKDVYRDGLDLILIQPKHGNVAWHVEVRKCR